MEQPPLQPKVYWPSVITYYVLACAISWPFFWWRDVESESWAAWQAPGFLKSMSYMWGPGLSALICFFLFRKHHVRTITFTGTSAWKSLLFYFVPIVVLAALLQNEEVWIMTIVGYVVILGEELGWRGYLQDALRSLRPWKRYVMIGVMWELWHFTNRTTNAPLTAIFMRVAIFMAFTILLSYIMGQLTDRTRSLTIAVTIHAWVNILFEFSGTRTYIVFACSILFWVWLIWRWERPFIGPKTALPG